MDLPSAIINTLVYNGDGLRFQKQDSTGTTNFIWDGQAYLAETNASNVEQAEYTNEPTQFGMLVSQRRLTSGLWVPSYYLYDALGSTTQLCNSAADVTDSYLYKAFGDQLFWAVRERLSIRFTGSDGSGITMTRTRRMCMCGPESMIRRWQDGLAWIRFGPRRIPTHIAMY